MPFVEREQVIEEKKKAQYLESQFCLICQKKKKINNDKANPPWLILLHCIYCIIGKKIDVSYFFIIC